MFRIIAIDFSFWAACQLLAFFIGILRIAFKKEDDESSYI